MLEHVGVYVGHIDSCAAFADELRESDTVAGNDDVPRLLQRVVQLRRDVERRQGDILRCKLPEPDAAF